MGLMKVEAAAEKYESRAKHATDPVNEREYTKMARKAQVGVEALREILIAKEKEEGAFELYSEMPLENLEKELNSLNKEVRNGLQAIDHLGGDVEEGDDEGAERRKEKREKRLSDATKQAEIMAAAIEKQRLRRATLR